jgi:cellobiose PTS system EIIA component
MDFEQQVWQLVLHGGNARSCAYEAMDAAESGDFKSAEKHLKEAEAAFREGHQVLTSILQSGDDQLNGLLMMHAQDHLMTAQAELNLIRRIIYQQQSIQNLEQRLQILEETRDTHARNHHRHSK